MEKSDKLNMNGNTRDPERDDEPRVLGYASTTVGPKSPRVYIPNPSGMKLPSIDPTTIVPAAPSPRSAPSRSSTGSNLAGNRVSGGPNTNASYDSSHRDGGGHGRIDVSSARVGISEGFIVLTNEHAGRVHGVGGTQNSVEDLRKSWDRLAGVEGRQSIRRESNQDAVCDGQGRPRSESREVCLCVCVFVCVCVCVCIYIYIYIYIYMSLMGRITGKQTHTGDLGFLCACMWL
jgi:hypothetical protein